MPNYRRYRVPGGTYFFTITLLNRRADMLTRHIDALREAIRQTRTTKPFHRRMGCLAGAHALHHHPPAW